MREDRIAAAVRYGAAHEAIRVAIRSSSTSTWLRRALEGALTRDPIDAANDAQVLAKLTDDLADAVTATARASLRA